MLGQEMSNESAAHLRLEVVVLVCVAIECVLTLFLRRGVDRKVDATDIFSVVGAVGSVIVDNPEMLGFVRAKE